MCSKKLKGLVMRRLGGWVVHLQQVGNLSMLT